MWLNPKFPADLVTFTEEILHGKLHFLCCVKNMMSLYFSNTLNNKFSKTWFYHLLQCVKSVRILSYSGPNFPHSDLIRRDIPDLSAFSPHAGKYGPEKLRIRTLFIKYSLHFFPPLQGLCHLSVTNQFL